MVRITIRLVGEENDRLFERITLEPKIHIDDLVKRIASITNIPPDFQQIEFRGRPLASSFHPLESIVDFEELIVKHSLLGNWTAYLLEFEEIRRLTTSDSNARNKRKRVAVQAREQLSPLDSCRFFITYPGLVKKRKEVDNEINFLVHNTAKYLKRSVAMYFQKFDVEFLDRPSKAAGVQLGFFVNVSDKSAGSCRKYYAKTVGGLPKAEFAPNEKPKIDLIELYVYKLLSLIGFGASEVHIIPDSTKSDRVYLATSLIEGFRMASGYLVDELLSNASASERKTVLSEENENRLNIVASILALIDLRDNNGNYGVVEQLPTEEASEAGLEPAQKLKIVDFRVDVVHGPRPPKTTTATSLESYIDQWKLRENIAVAKQLIMEDEAIKNATNLNVPQFDTYVTEIQAILDRISAASNRQ